MVKRPEPLLCVKGENIKKKKRQPSLLHADYVTKILCKASSWYGFSYRSNVIHGI